MFTTHPKIRTWLTEPVWFEHFLRRYCNLIFFQKFWNVRGWIFARFLTKSKFAAISLCLVLYTWLFVYSLSWYICLRIYPNCCSNSAIGYPKGCSHGAGTMFPPFVIPTSLHAMYNRVKHWTLRQRNLFIFVHGKKIC